MILTFSFAQSLRAIGQELEGLGVEVFEIEKGRETYILRMKRNEKVSTDSLLKRFAKIVRGSFSSAKETLGSGPAPGPVAFNGSDIAWMDSYGRSRRGGASHIVADAQKISLGLRVIGDYLDRRQARSFAIWWSSPSVISLNYKATDNENRLEHFNAADLYDLGVHMYLRRSNRFRVT